VSRVLHNVKSPTVSRTTSGEAAISIVVIIAILSGRLRDLGYFVDETIK